MIAIDRESEQPLYRQLYEGYRNAIAERRLRGGQRLPSTRALASELGISRIPVLNAFEQLLAEGYFETRPGSGTFVARSLPTVTTPARPVDGSAARARPRQVARRVALLRGSESRWLRGKGPFNVGQVPADRFPLAAWSRFVARRWRHTDRSLLAYGPTMGLPALREAVAEYLRTARAVRCEAEQVLIVSGSQQALALTARVLIDPGSPVWLEEPGDFGAQNVLVGAGAELVPVPVDDEGLDVAAGLELCPRPRAVFVTPSHQFPLGVTMSAARRLQLLDWASDTGTWIVEDDYDSEYRFSNQPIASLQGLDRAGRVIYIGTFTKILFSSLRLGYLVVPPDLVPAFVEARRAADMSSPTLPQAALADFIREGHFARHIRRTRALCRERRAALVDAIDRRLRGALEVLGDEAGMYLTAALPRGSRDRPISERAAEQGLWLAPLSECYLGQPERQGFLLGYAGTPDDAIAAALERLAALLERPPS